MRDDVAQAVELGRSVYWFDGYRAHITATLSRADPGKPAGKPRRPRQTLCRKQVPETADLDTWTRDAPCEECLKHARIF